MNLFEKLGIAFMGTKIHSYIMTDTVLRCLATR
jgi:hypothetical protein